jgi:NAD-dependent dihydropyrimidine dehydrogenase PreA subunit
MNKITLDREFCSGCKNCLNACFIDVIKWDAEAKRPFIAYPEKCVQCMYCEFKCPQHAIKVLPDYQSDLSPGRKAAPPGD